MSAMNHNERPVRFRRRTVWRIIVYVAIAIAIAMVVIGAERRPCRREPLDGGRTLCICPSGRGGDRVTVLHGAGEICE